MAPLIKNFKYAWGGGAAAAGELEERMDRKQGLLCKMEKNCLKRIKKKAFIKNLQLNGLIHRIVIFENDDGVEDHRIEAFIAFNLIYCTTP